MSIIQKTIKEIKKLQSLTDDSRSSEGINASVSQLKELLKSLERIERESNKKHNLSGMKRYVSDYASQDSKLLNLIEKVIRNHGSQL